MSRFQGYGTTANWHLRVAEAAEARRDDSLGLGWNLFTPRRNFQHDIVALLFDASEHDKVICRIALGIAVI